MLLFWGILAAVAVLDRAAKLWAAAALRGGRGLVVLPRLLEMRYTQNRGMALGFLAGQWLANLALPVVAVVVWVLLGRRYEPTRFKRVASALMLGGFVGNFLDRLLFGYVVDMIYFPWLPWFVCNVADIAICAGVVMLVVSLLLRPRDWREKRAEDEGASAP